MKMLKPLGAISLLHLTSALVAPSLAFAQSAEPAVAEAAEPTPKVTTSETADQPAEEEEVDVSIGGQEIVVRGYLDRNISKICGRDYGQNLL